MKLDPKGIKAALYEMIDKGDFYYAPDVEDVETAILAYLKATDSVVVPREAVSIAEKGGSLKRCEYCNRHYGVGAKAGGRSSKAKFCSESHRSLAYRKRKQNAPYPAAEGK